MKSKVICGIQQVGIGVSDINDSLPFYTQLLDYDKVVSLLREKN